MPAANFLLSFLFFLQFVDWSSFCFCIFSYPFPFSLSSMFNCICIVEKLMMNEWWQVLRAGWYSLVRNLWLPTVLPGYHRPFLRPVVNKFCFYYISSYRYYSYPNYHTYQFKMAIWGAAAEVTESLLFPLSGGTCDWMPPYPNMNFNS